MGYNDESFNHVYAKANFYYTMDSERAYVKNLVEILKRLNSEFYTSVGWRREQKWEERRQVVKDIRDCSYLKSLSKAIDTAREVAFDTHNILMYERLAELQGVYGRITPLGTDSRTFLKSEAKNYKKIKKTLMYKVLCNNRKQRGLLEPKDEPQLYFALAKNLMFSENDTKYANEIFSALASREYSKTLQDAISGANAKKDRWNDLREMSEEDMRDAGYGEDVVTQVKNMQQTMNYLDSLDETHENE